MISKEIITNKTIIEFVLDYASLMEWKADEVKEIKKIRIYKKAIIPGELVGMNGRQIILCYQDISKKVKLDGKLSGFL